MSFGSTALDFIRVVERPYRLFHPLPDLFLTTTIIAKLTPTSYLVQVFLLILFTIIIIRPSD